MSMDPVTPWSERAIRPLLRVGALFNAVVALSLLLPAAGPAFHRWVLAWFVALFGAAYGWMARQAAIPRALVALAAIGKAGVFAIALACLLRRELDLSMFAVAVVDLAFAAVFTAWLRASRR
jgi:hypothetical protein